MKPHEGFHIKEQHSDVIILCILHRGFHIKEQHSTVIIYNNNNNNNNNNNKKNKNKKTHFEQERKNTYC